MSSGLGEDTITRIVTDTQTDDGSTLVRNYTQFFLRKSGYNNNGNETHHT